MWLKNIRQRKLQTVMIFLIVAICTTLLAGAISILTSLNNPSKEFVKTCQTASAKFHPYTYDEAKIRSIGEQLKKFSSVKKVEYVKLHYIDESLLLNGKKAEVFTHLTEYNHNVFGSDVYIEGKKGIGKILKEDECILPVCISNKYNIHIGDTVTIKSSKKDIVYKVAAVYTDPFQTDTAFDSDILVKKIPASVNSDSVIFVYGKEGVTGKEIKEAYLEKYNGILNGSINTVEERTDNGLRVGRIIGAMFLAIGIIMLLVSALMIQYMIKNAMIADSKTIAIYKSMGYTSNDIMVLYLKFYLMIITLACIVGIYCSILISNNILLSIFQNMGQIKVHNSLLSGLICYLVVAGLVISVITTMIAKTRKIKPVFALNGIDYGGVKKRKRYKGNSTLMFSSLGIAYRTFIREKKSMIGIIITCIVTIFSVNFIVISLDIANSMKENNDFWLGIDKSDVMISITDKNEYDRIKDIVLKDSRTDYCLDSFFHSWVSMKWKKGMDVIGMSAFVYADIGKAKLSVSAGRNPKASDEIAISTTLAKQLNKSIGDYLQIYLAEGKKADMLITGLYQAYIEIGEVCRLTSSAYSENGIELDYNNISVYLNKGVDLNDYIQDIKKKVGSGGNVIKRTQQYASAMEMISGPQQRAIPPVAALIMLIAGLNIFSIVYLKNMRAQKINGIYKCIGYTTWHLISSNMIYVTGIALASLIITLPISILTYSPIMKLSLSMFNFMEYPMQVNTLHLMVTNIAVFIVFIISTLASSRELVRVNARILVQE